MAIDLDDEILQDFLVEAGEIVELLGEQLVELEQSPGDYDLLNAIFRGFHTIKGGAGFLAIDAMVAICHKAEDVFNCLRQGDRRVTQDLMDVVLEVLDVVNNMFDNVRAGEDPEHANAELLQRLQTFTTAQPADSFVQLPTPVVQEIVTPAAMAAPVPASHEILAPAKIADAVEREFEAMLSASFDDDDTVGADDDTISEAEFDELLDALHGKGSVSANTQVLTEEYSSDDISEAEFDDLLDQLHGKGKFSVELPTPAPVVIVPAAIVTALNSSNNDDITEDEFDALLDDLHGKGKFSAVVLDSVSPAIVPSTIFPRQKESVISAPPPAQPEAIVIKSPSKVSPRAEPALVHTPELTVETDSPAKKNNNKPAAGNQAENTVRVDTQILDDIMNMVGELVLVRNRFQTLKANMEVSEQMGKTMANLDIVTADLQLAVMKTRMQPIKKVFGRFPRVVRDLARSLNKEIRLELVGEETDLDKNLVEALADPLVHLVRNAVDHGIETPAEREAAGKPREGVVILKASQEGDHIELSIKDDGKGMNASVLRAKVVEKGLMDEDSAARLDNKECFNLIFMPGFSTKTEISDVSGRGVGMDVVKTRINQMNGTVEVDSKEGIGSTIIIKVPLTLAIMPTLMVKLGEQAFALPLASVLEILDLDLSNTNVVDGQLVVMVRRKALPLFFLSEWLINDCSYVTQKKRMGHVVVVNAGGRQVGFVVDQLIGQEEVVIKALGAKLHGLDGLSGATITGDGKIALILDVPGLMHRYAS
ncbi:MAG: chemotaxis protein CheA [Methylococcales bacterium]|nr:chemotaxis protein CheA [Methylococcales bacterium]